MLISLLLISYSAVTDSDETNSPCSCSNNIITDNYAYTYIDACVGHLGTYHTKKH